MVTAEKQRFWEIIIPGIILAFALSVLAYVGSALFQAANLAHIPEPSTALGGALLGMILGLGGSRGGQRDKNRDLNA